MSVKQEVVIEADDITIVQGEKVKDYNVKLSKVDGSPISNLPVTIAFYNKDNSFSHEVTTNTYGVASVPLYLTGDSWKVDVHFRGNNEYAPSLVTKNVIIQKFERINTNIRSENLHINEDNVISTDEGWYTVYLTDANDLPVIYEPISFLIVSSKENVEDVTFTLNTDENGKIVVPYLTHDDTVTIFSEYNGCTRFYPTEKEDIVSFDDITDRTEVSFGEFTEDGENYLQIKLGNGNWQEIEESGLIERCIVNDLDNDRLSHDDIFFYTSSKPKTYQITLFYKGNSNYFSKVETLNLTRLTDTRITLLDWGEHRGTSWNTTKRPFEEGGLLHYTFNVSGFLPNEPYYIASYSDVTTPLGVVMPQFTTKRGFKQTILDFIIKTPNDNPFGDYSHNIIVWIKPNDYIKADNNSTVSKLFVYRTDSGTVTSRDECNLYANGFGTANSTYQSIEVYCQNDLAINYDNINDYYIMQLVDEATMEEFYFYSYLIDNVTPSHSDFLLGLGDWQMFLVSKETENYDSGFYYDTATLNNENPVVYISDFFYDEDNWTDYGTSVVIDEVNGTISATDSDTLSVSKEFTSSNVFTLNFEVESTGTGGTVLLGADHTSETYGIEGIILTEDTLQVYKEQQLVDLVRFEGLILSGKFELMRNGEKWDLYRENELIYTTDLLSFNTIGLQFTGSVLKNVNLYEEPNADITPPVETYDGDVFGSNIHFDIRNNQLDLIDYGMLPSGATGGGNVIVNDVPLPNTDLELQLDIKYNNTRFDRLENLNGEIQARIYTDIATSELAKEYSQVLCSPMPVPNVETVFTRHSDEGILYYIKDPKMTANTKTSPYYLCNAYNQYKGGVEIKTETGISLFNLDNAYSPVVVGNELVSAEFHRRSGYIKLARYDENTNDWYTVNILKLRNNPQLVLNEYNDDYAELQFGKTIWKFYRGRPFIICNHEEDDLRILNLVDRIYCETIPNQRGLGFIDEVNPNEREVYENDDGKQIASYSVFDPQVSIQKFKQELHIGENIRSDNFEAYDVLPNGYVGDVSETTLIGTIQVDNENALIVQKNDTDKVAINFPSYSNYVKRVDKTFSLLIQHIDSDFSNVTIKARGFDDKGAVPVMNGLQYGIWEQSHNVTLDTTETDELRVTFTDCPTEVKYIDFLLIINDSTTGEIVLKDFMYYDGDTIIEHQTDTSIAYAEQVEINFEETYYANLYNQDEGFGLCVMRPSKHKFSLKSIYADSETVFAPYMKKCKEWDKPSQLFLEYLNANRQTIDIDWEN